MPPFAFPFNVKVAVDSMFYPQTLEVTAPSFVIIFSNIESSGSQLFENSKARRCLALEFMCKNMLF